MGKRILIIQGHPDEQSFNHALHLAYKKGATRAGAEIQEIFVSQLTFNPNLRYGYRQRTDLEPCLIEAQNKIKWAEHIVLVYPVWWGSLPAILKGFFDRVFRGAARTVACFSLEGLGGFPVLQAVANRLGAGSAYRGRRRRESCLQAVQALSIRRGKLSAPDCQSGGRHGAGGLGP